jgi:hypothetical protein
LDRVPFPGLPRAGGGQQVQLPLAILVPDQIADWRACVFVPVPEAGVFAKQEIAQLLYGPLHRAPPVNDEPALEHERYGFLDEGRSLPKPARSNIKL